MVKRSVSIKVHDSFRGFPNRGQEGPQGRQVAPQGAIAFRLEDRDLPCGPKDLPHRFREGRDRERQVWELLLEVPQSLREGWEQLREPPLRLRDGWPFEKEGRQRVRELWNHLLECWERVRGLPHELGSVRLTPRIRWRMRIVRALGAQAKPWRIAMPVEITDPRNFNVLPIIDLSEPTRPALRAEAAALGSNYTAFTGHPADLLADGSEMVEARQDIDELIERGYPVSMGLVNRIDLLTQMIAPLIAEQERTTEWSKTQTERAEESRRRLLEIRSTLSRIGKAAGLPATLFSLETKKTTRLNVVMMKMEAVLENVGSVRKHLPDKKRVDALVTEARELLDEQTAMRLEARLTAVDARAQVQERKRYERLLYDAMIYLSAQGLAAYDGDETREIRYRLDHVYGRKASKVGDPGAGGTEGDPNAGGPSDDS